MTADSRVVRRLGAVVATAIVALSAAPVTGQNAADSPSAAAALVALMTDQKLDSAGTEDPAHPGRFLAVLHIPGVQLLAVAGECEAVDALRARVTRRAYRDLYMDLNACAAKASKLFIQDMGADGLHASQTGSSVDIAYEHIDQQTIFNADWKAQKLSESEYRSRFARVEAAYAELLAKVLGHLKGA